MVIRWLHDLSPLPSSPHYLIFAEEGFSMLTVHAEALGVPPGVRSLFVSSVNARDEVGTLFPEYPLTAIPRRAIRDTTDSAVAEGFVREALEGLARAGLSPTTLVIDLRTPKLPEHARRALRSVLDGERLGSIPGVDEILVAE